MVEHDCVFFSSRSAASFTELKKIVKIKMLTFIQEVCAHFVDDMVSDSICHWLLDESQIHIMFKHIPGPRIRSTPNSANLYPPRVWLPFDVLFETQPAIELDHGLVD